MCEIARIIGGAGTGKTTRLLGTMDKLIGRGYDPREIGFVSFTRAARAEAAHRAALAFDLKPEDLEVGGWFRTIHSICYRQLGVGSELITGSAKDREWIANAIGEEITGLPTGEEDTEFHENSGESREPTDGDKSLSIWSVARSRMVPLADQYALAAAIEDNLPAIEHVRSVVDRYEQAKRLDGRSDFSDLLSRFAGVGFSHDGAPYDRRPEGEVPTVPVWFFDEQQDTSALLDRVCRRLIESADYAYLCLDPFQAIYSFAGADARHAMAWRVQSKNEHILPQSHRCPPPILSLGEAVLRGCSDYWDRGIKPADREGRVDEIDFREQWTHNVDPRGSWLLIARTNFQAKRIASRLEHDGIPWIPTKGNGGWSAPTRNTAIRTLRRAQREFVIDVRGWQAVCKQIKSKTDDGELLERGAKTAATKLDGNELRTLDTADEWGMTDLLKELIVSGRWRRHIKGAEQWDEAAKKWGDDAVDVDHWPANRGVRVGTIHSVKGAEADNVLLLTTTSGRVQRSIDATTDGEDAERRVAYVGITRSKSRLLIANEPTQFRMEIPAA